MNYIFRFDDVCINADNKLISDMTDYLFELFPSCRVLHGVSPAVQDGCGERVFHKILNAYSDYTVFYNVDRIGLPPKHPRAEWCSHGLIHVDHRLLDPSAQEMSILTSCSLTKSKTFIPPFNKWNVNTANICSKHGIELIKFEDGWLCMEYNKFNRSHKNWYLHAREFTLDRFKQWLS